jgi:CRP/FNR family cyclic AMP-dependent transcriptional regulator
MSTELPLLSDVPIFASLDDDERAVLAKQIDHQHYPAGSTIFRAGEAGGAMYVVRTGRVELWLYDEDKQRVVLADLEEGELFG